MSRLRVSPRPAQDGPWPDPRSPGPWPDPRSPGPWPDPRSRARQEPGSPCSLTLLRLDLCFPRPHSTHGRARSSPAGAQPSCRIAGGSTGVVLFAAVLFQGHRSSRNTAIQEHRTTDHLLPATNRHFFRHSAGILPLRAFPAPHLSGKVGARKPRGSADEPARRTPSPPAPGSTLKPCLSGPFALPTTSGGSQGRPTPWDWVAEYPQDVGGSRPQLKKKPGYRKDSARKHLRSPSAPRPGLPNPPSTCRSRPPSTGSLRIEQIRPL